MLTRTTSRNRATRWKGVNRLIKDVITKLVWGKRNITQRIGSNHLTTNTTIYFNQVVVSVHLPEVVAIT